MDVRAGLLFLFVMGASWASDARQLAAPELSDRSVVFSDMSVMQPDNLWQESEVRVSETKNENLCTLCEEFAAQALDYFTDNKTQTEIMDSLHTSCSRVPSFEQECLTLVDYYAPLFFLEISSILPEDFCRKFNLCEQNLIISSQLHEDSCEICHHAVSEVLVKLKDPDTQLEIIELLLKGCNSMEKYAKKCKRLVFEYGPLILVNAEQFLETTDVCTALHACASSKRASRVVDLSALADS